MYHADGAFIEWVELVWCSGCVVYCHATARGSIPCGNSVKTELHVLCKKVNVGAVCKCRWDVKHNQPTNLLNGKVFKLFYRSTRRLSNNIYLYKT